MISVAMTTYNGERFVKQQIQSILNQTIQVDEIIICDDGSIDRTEKIIKDITDLRIKYVRNDVNLGYIENFYKAISLTNGDYIFLADQDDIWTPNKVHLLIEHMKMTGAVAVCTNFELIDSNGQIIKKREDYSIDPFVRKCKDEVADISTQRLAFGNVAQGCTYCFTKAVKEVYLKIHNQEVIHDLQIMIIASCIGKVHLINQKLIQYRIHGSNSIGFAKKGGEIDIPKTIRREPFMYRFFRQVNDVVPVKNLWFYKMLYYCRIPYLRAVIRRKLRLD